MRECRHIPRPRVWREFWALTNGQTEVAWVGYSVPLVEGIHLLASLPNGTREEKVREGAIAAIDLHGDTAADRVLEQFVGPEQLRDQFLRLR